MADQTMTVVTLVKTGILDVAGNASAKAGNAAGGNNFLIPNNGHTFLAVSAVTGDTITFTATSNKYGRTETLAPVMASGKFCLFGPFPPHLWNNGAGPGNLQTHGRQRGRQVPRR